MAINPNTAHLCFYYGPPPDDPDVDSIGRIYYWVDPDGVEPSMLEHELREQHPEIDDETWRRLLVEAFDRGEREYLLKLKAADPAIFESREGLRDAFISYAFGPGAPSPATLEALNLDYGVSVSRKEV